MNRLLVAMGMAAWVGVGCAVATPPTATPAPSPTPIPSATSTAAPPTPTPTATPPPPPLAYVATLGRGTLQLLAVAPDEQTIAAGSGTGVTLHDAQTLGELWSTTLIGFYSVALGWSADASHIYVARRITPEDRTLTVAVLDSRDGDIRRTFEVEGMEADFSPDGTRLLMNDWYRGEWYLYDTATGDLLPLPDFPPQTSMWWLPDGRLVSGEANLDASTYALRDVLSGDVMLNLNIELYHPQVFAFSPTGDRIAIQFFAYDQQTEQSSFVTRLWDLETDDWVWQIEGMELHELMWVDDDTLLGIQGYAPDHVYVRLDAATGAVIQEYRGGPLPYYGLGGGLLRGPQGTIIGRTADTFYLYTADTFQPLAHTTGYLYEYEGARFSPDGDHILTTAGSAAIIWEARTGEELRRIDGVTGAGAWSPDGEQIAVVDWYDGTAGMWDARTGMVRGGFETGFTSPYVALWLAGGHLFAAGTTYREVIWHDEASFEVLEEYAIALFDMATGETLFRQETPANVETAAAAPDGRAYAYSLHEPERDDGWIVIADAATGEHLTTLTTQPSYAYALAWSPDGKRLAAAFGVNVAVWERGGRRVSTLDMPPNVGLYEGSLGWSADGRQVYAVVRHTSRSASYLVIWDAETGERLNQLIPLGDGPFYGKGASPDGELFLLDHYGIFEVWALIAPSP